MIEVANGNRMVKKLNANLKNIVLECNKNTASYCVKKFATLR